MDSWPSRLLPWLAAGLFAVAPAAGLGVEIDEPRESGAVALRAVAGAAVSDHAHPEVEVDPELSLAETVRSAEALDPGVYEVEARAQEAAALRSASGRWLAGAPTVYGSYITDGVGSQKGYRQWGAGLELPLWWPRQRAPRGREAAAAAMAGERAPAARSLEVAGRVRAAVASLELARIRLQLARSELAADESLTEQVARAVELGELAERELLLAQSSSLERRADQLAALEEMRHAEADYILLTGLSRAPADWAERPRHDARLEDHPTLELAHADRARAEADVERIERQRWGSPLLAIGSQNERDTSQADYSRRMAVGVRIPLGRRDALSSGLASALRAAGEARLYARRLERELHGRLMRAEHRIELATARVATANEQARLSADYLDRTERGFALGEVDLFDLILARARARRAEWAHREAELLRRFHVAEYNQALGVLP